MNCYDNINSELLLKLKKGDITARDKLCEENMGLVGKLAAAFSKNGIPKEDLIQTGAIGLIKAIDNFDLSMGVKFSTYAVPVILGEIRRFLRDDGLIKVSRSVKELSQKGIRAREELKKTLAREPTLKEISAKCAVSVEDLIYAFDAVREPESINSAVFDDSDESLSDRIAKEDAAEKITDKILVEEMLSGLSVKERQVIVLRYYKDRSQQEIADMLGVSQVQVSRIEKKVLEKLRLCEL